MASSFRVLGLHVSAMHWEAISYHRITVSPKTPAQNTSLGKKGDEIAYLIEDMYNYILCYIL